VDKADIGQVAVSIRDFVRTRSGGRRLAAGRQEPSGPGARELRLEPLRCPRL